MKSRIKKLTKEQKKEIWKCPDTLYDPNKYPNLKTSNSESSLDAVAVRSMRNRKTTRGTP